MRLVTVFACATLMMPGTAFGQAGSIGGTVAKTDKSISGEEQSEPQHRLQGERPSRGAAAAEKTTGNLCQKIVGKWAWINAGGTSETVFSPGGTGQNPASGLTSAWTCNNGIAIVRWSNGYSDRVTISRDGNSLSILNPMGQLFSATRY
jgi:hypothetical protein